MISDLSPGDKLSLKGKIFELQKKLQIIDIRKKQNEEYPYKPKTTQYELPDRNSNVLESINKAELIRKQRKELLQAAVQLQSDEGCTFAPTIHTSKSRHSHNANKDKRPVHLRLTEKGKVYNNLKIQRREQFSKYDGDGRRLFTPAINKDTIHDKSHGGVNNFRYRDEIDDQQENRDLSPPPPPPSAGPGDEGVAPAPTSEESISAAAADEFLYQDARDREERYRMRYKESQREVVEIASASKMNTTSHHLIKRRAEREAREAFRLLAAVPEGTDYRSLSLGIDDIQRTVETLLVPGIQKQLIKSRSNKNIVVSGGAVEGSMNDMDDDPDDVVIDEAETARLVNCLWSLLDPQQVGDVTVNTFVKVTAPLLLHSTVSAALVDIKKVHAAVNIPDSGTTTASSPIDIDDTAHNQGSSEGLSPFRCSLDDLQTFQLFLRKLLSQSDSSVKSLYSEGSSSVAANKAAQLKAQPTFKPHIFDHSYKLASKKEKKERRRIEQILAQSSSGGDRGEVVSIVDREAPSHNTTSITPTTTTATTTSGNNAQSACSTSLESAHPAPAETTAAVAASSSLSHHDVMYARGLLVEQKKQTLAQDMTAKRLKECTFQPKIRPIPITSTVAATLKGIQNKSVSSSQAGSIPMGDETGDAASSSLGNSSPMRMNELTTQEPAASAPSNRGATSGEAPESVPVHDRLYRLKDKMKSRNLVDPSTRIVEEMQACTFSPQMDSSFNHRLQKFGSKGNKVLGEADEADNLSTASSPKPIQGYQKSVERLRKVNEEKIKKQEEESHEKQREALEKRYARSRQMARKGAAPFTFRLDARKAATLEEHAKRDTPPDLLVDVKLSVTKTAKIPIWKGDDPFDLAQSFALIYSLDVTARDLLVQVITQSMEQNGLIEVKQDDIKIESQELAPPPPTQVLSPQFPTMDSQVTFELPVQYSAESYPEVEEEEEEFESEVSSTSDTLDSQFSTNS